MTRPADIADDLAWCSCGRRIWGHDRHEFERTWYEHLAAMVRNDPDGDHRLGSELDGDGIPTHVAGASADSWRYDQ